jgi:hypothetical protein
MADMIVCCAEEVGQRDEDKSDEAKGQGRRRRKEEMIKSE